MLSELTVYEKSRSYSQRDMWTILSNTRPDLFGTKKYFLHQERGQLGFSVCVENWNRSVEGNITTFDKEDWFYRQHVEIVFCNCVENGDLSWLKSCSDSQITATDNPKSFMETSV